LALIVVRIIALALALITLKGIFTAISNDKGIATILGALAFIAIFAYAGVAFWKEPRLNKNTKGGFDLQHSKGLTSCAGIIEQSENEIAWSGLAAVIHNGSVADVYLLAECLKKVEAYEKHFAISKLTKAFDDKMGGPPPAGKDVNGYAVAESFEQWIKEAEKAYEDSNEDAIELTKKYSKKHSDSEKDKLKSDAGISELAKELISEISPSDILTGSPEVISIDLSEHIETKDCKALFRSLEPKLGDLVSGKGNLKTLNQKFDYVKSRWGKPIHIEFVNCDELKSHRVMMYMELYQWFPLLFDRVSGIKVTFDLK